MGKRSQKKKRPVEVPTAKMSPGAIGKMDWLRAALLFAAVVLAYLPVWQAGFIWDDDAHLTANACIVGPKGLVDVWTSSAAYYFPLTLTTWWFMHSFWGLEPLPYHLANVAAHGACAILLWRILLRLQIPGAWLGAALWALHPVQVESVAWVSEFINEQSGFFYLLAIWFYASGAAEKTRAFKRDYFLALLCALLALLSKPSTVMLPVVLVLVEWWRGGRWSWREVAGLVPFFLLSAAMSGWTIWEQKYHSGASGVEWNQSWPERIAIAGKDGWFYLFKLAWPHPLIFVYPQWQVDAGRGADYLPTLAWAGMLAGLWRWRKGPLRPVFFALAYFTISLFPVLGFFDVYFFRYSFVADHFQYLASMGPLALAGAGLVKLADIVIPGRPWLRSGLCAVLLLVLGTVSWQRAWVYENEETLWTDTLARNPNCSMADNNLGELLLKEGRVDAAMDRFQEALKIATNDAEAHNDLGSALSQKGQVKEAMAEFPKALAIDPTIPEAYNNLGLALFQKGQWDEAISQFLKALAINPNSAEAYNNLGLALVQKGELDEALAEYQKALAIHPDYASAHINFGNALLQAGRMDEAMAEFQEALKIDPDLALARNALGVAFFQKGQVDEAMAQFRKAVEINPDNAEARNSLGNALLQAGRMDEAMTQYQKALAINPNNTDAHYNLGIALKQTGEVREAMAQFQEVLRLNPNDRGAQDNLAKIRAMLGQAPVSK